MSRNFTAKFAGRCVKCAGAINIGDSITWARRGEKGILHKDCTATETPMVFDPQTYPPIDYSPKPPPVNSDALAGFAALLQPYIQGQHRIVDGPA